MATTNVFASIRREEENKLERRRLLQRLLDDESASTIQRTTARVELALLTSGDRKHKKDELLSTGLVSRTAAERERYIKREAERRRREAVIVRIQALLREQGAIMSEERRRRLEDELARAEKDMEQWEEETDDVSGEHEDVKKESPVIEDEATKFAPCNMEKSFAPIEIPELPLTRNMADEAAAIIDPVVARNRARYEETIRTNAEWAQREAEIRKLEKQLREGWLLWSKAKRKMLVELIARLRRELEEDIAEAMGKETEKGSCLENEDSIEQCEKIDRRGENEDVESTVVEEEESTEWTPSKNPPDKLPPLSYCSSSLVTSPPGAARIPHKRRRATVATEDSSSVLKYLNSSSLKNETSSWWGGNNLSSLSPLITKKNTFARSLTVVTDASTVLSESTARGGFQTEGSSVCSEESADTIEIKNSSSSISSSSSRKISPSSFSPQIMKTGTCTRKTPGETPPSLVFSEFTLTVESSQMKDPSVCFEVPADTIGMKNGLLENETSSSLPQTFHPPLISDSSASAVELDKASLADSSASRPIPIEEESYFPPRTVSLEQQVQILLKEAELREESMQLMVKELEDSQRKNEKRIAEMEKHLVELTKNEYPTQLQYWKEKALEFSKKVHNLEVELDEKEEEVDDMVELKRIQDGKIESLQKEVEQLKLERDRAEEVVNKLLISPKKDSTRRASASMFKDQRDHSVATAEWKEDGAKVEALEARVASIEAEKARMEAELEEMRRYADANVKTQKPRQNDIKKRTKTKRLIYQVSCRNCPKDSKNCCAVGVTTEDLKTKILELAKQSAVAAKEAPKSTGLRPSSKIGGLFGSSSYSGSSVTDSSLSEETKKEDAFVKHLASHVPKKVAKNESDALSFCKTMIRVEILKKISGEELYWRDNLDE